MTTYPRQGPLSRRACWPRPHAVGPAPQHSTYLPSDWSADARCGGHSAHTRAPPRIPAHTGTHRHTPAHTVRPALARRNPAARASSIGGVSRSSDQLLTRSVTARLNHAVEATRGSLSGRSRCYRCCCRTGCPSTPSASRWSSCRPSSPGWARRRGPGRRAGCPQLPRW